MNKVHDLNPSFHYAGPHLFLGAFYGGRSKFLGGKPEKSRHHFEKALELTENKYLLANLIFAKTYQLDLKQQGSPQTHQILKAYLLSEVEQAFHLKVSTA